MTQALRNYVALGGSLDTKYDNNVTVWDMVLVIFIELSKWVSKVKCYDRLLDILI